MPTYVVGDVQGCYDALMSLLKKIQFCRHYDTLIFAGDLVNRGPKSLEVLRFVKSLGNCAKVVLGNHDIYLMAVAFGLLPQNKKDTITPVLQAQDKYELIDWLCRQKLLIVEDNAIITHAGVAPIWSLGEAKKYTAEIEKVLQTDYQRTEFLKHLFGNSPSVWHESLKGVDRWRCIVNYFTRMRICDAKGNMNFDFTGDLQSIPSGFYAWFTIPNLKINETYTLIFGHWAALNGKTNSQRHIALDTGCVWGGKLTAYCITTQKYYRVSAA